MLDRRVSPTRAIVAELSSDEFRAWVYFFLPEFKDRTLEEIDEMVC